jgi:hypothetical protein
LTDTLPPTFEADPQAALAPGDVVSKPISITTVAHDRGSGIARAWLEVDGINRGPASFESGIECTVPFTKTIPCPLQTTLSARLDPQLVGDGKRSIRFGVEDAAGNQTMSRTLDLLVAAGPLGRASIDAPAVPNGNSASRFVRLKSWFTGRSRRAVKTVRHGQSVDVEGRLTTANDLAIANATLSVEERVSSRVRRRTSVRTDAGGRFRYHVSAGPGRTVAFAYTAFSNDAAPVATSSTSLRVRAGVTLRTSKRLVRNGTALRFSGRVLGERGTRRALVTIYALSGGRRARIPVETVRARSDGRFSYTYRFGSITGPSVYRFEARVPRQTGFPYLEGASPRVTVRGRP